MKKTLAFLLAVAMLVALAAGCSGKNADKVIPAAAFQTQSELILPMKAELNSGDYLTYGGHQFETSKKLEKMAKMIVKENDNVEKTLYENAYGKCWLFTTEATGGVNSWCLYQMDPANTKNLYIFSGLHRELNTEDGPLDLLVPLHLISDSYIRDNMGSRMELDTHYTCGAEDAEVPMADLFRAFYLESGLYSVTDSDYGFTVMPMKGMSLQLQFIFEENADGAWFTIKDVTYREPKPTENVSVRWLEDGMDEAVLVTLGASDALQLSGLLITFYYGSGDAGIEYPYIFDLNGERYMARVLWEDDSWSGTASYNGQTAVLNDREAAALAANLYLAGVLSMAESPEIEIDGDVTPMAACMTTTTEVNVRDEPSTDGERIVILDEDTAVAVVGEVDNGWMEIIYDGQLAYMSGDYLRMVG